MADGAASPPPRRVRADARRNSDAVLDAARAVFAASGVDAPAKQIADRAGVGVGTLYRHYPQRAHLVRAVLEREVDACVDAAPQLTATLPPGAALRTWLLRYAELVATKRGLATAFHSGDAAFEGLPEYFLQRFGAALGPLLDAAAASGEVRADVTPKVLLYAVASLCLPMGNDGTAYSGRMVSLLVDGLRHGAGPASAPAG